MGSSDRKPYETATAITQDFLDECAGNLVCNLELTVDVMAPLNAVYQTVNTTRITITSEAHGLAIGETVTLLSADFPNAAGDYTVLITGYGTDQFTIDLGAPISHPSNGDVKYLGWLRFSDRNKYVGAKFYEARTIFPTITRTVGELLSPTLEFSTLQIEINNADGKFNRLMPSGDDYGAWPGARVVVKLGLRDVESTYAEIFSGEVTHEGGFQRGMKSFILVARNDFDRLNSAQIPIKVFTQDDYPNLDPDKVGLSIPIIYGNWTASVETDMASVPAYSVNGMDLDVTGEGSPHSSNVQLVISHNDLSYFDTTEVYVKRSDLVVRFDAADIVNVDAGNKSFELRQSATAPLGVTLIDGVVYDYERGDEFFVKVKGKNLGSTFLSENPVWQARDILMTYAGVDSSLFDANWVSYRNKNLPTQSAIINFKSRCWIQQSSGVLEYALSLLEQIRLEAFIDLNGKIKLTSLHFDDFNAIRISTDYTVRNWDIEEGSFIPQMDLRNNFNRAQAVYNFLPNRNENYQSTRIHKNVLAIEAIGKEISKRIVYPNLYDEQTVKYQLIETLRLMSGYPEHIDMTLTWRARLRDIGQILKIDVQIGSSVFAESPLLLREVGYNPEGLKIQTKGISLQMIPFPGYAPTTSGITGGYDAVITEE